MIAEINDKPALVSDSYNISYEQLYENIASFASLLDEPKEELKIAIFSENRPEWVYALNAIWARHCIAVPLDYLSGNDELEYMLSDASPGVVFCSEERKNKLEEIQKKVDFTFSILVFEEMENDSTEAREKTPMFVEDKDKTALVLYTSGTTGNPKGVILSFKNLLFNIHAVSQKVKIMEPHDRMFKLLPLHHIFPLMGTVVIPFYRGCTVVVAPSLVAEEFTKTMQKFKPTLLIGVPRLYESMHNRISAKIKSNVFTKMIFNLARASQSKAFSGFVFKTVHNRMGGAIKYLVSGGARLDPVIFNDFRTLGFEVLEGYGLTETAPMITFNRPGKSRAGSPGRPVPGLQTQIKENELIVKGDNVMLGYLNLEKETGEKIKDGWFHTGDLGYFDNKNYLFLTGRKNEIIVLPNGKKVNPLEIEDKITRLDTNVKEVGVFMHENVLQAIIHPDFEHLEEKGKEQLQHHFKINVFDKINEMVSNHKRITKFHLSKSELPKTRLGKVKRFELAGMLEQKLEEKPGKRNHNSANTG